MKKYHQTLPKKLSKNDQVNKLLSFRFYNGQDSLKLLYLFITVSLVGAVVSSLYTTDTRWMNWHISRLGEGGKFSSIIFNITVLVSATIMFMMAISLSEKVFNINSDLNIDIKRANLIIYRALTAATLCLIGVAMFPFDRYPAIHNICGYSMLFIYLALCTYAPKFLPIFSKNFYLYSKFVILLVIICYILYIIFQVVTLLQIELIIFTFMYGWFLLFIKGIYKNCDSYVK